MARVIAAQKPDAQGGVIPEYVQMGSALISNPLGEHEPLNIVVNEVAFNAANATCSGCCLVCAGLVSLACALNNFDVANGSSMQMTATAKYNNGSTNDVTGSSSSKSSTTAVATVQTSGQTSPGLTTGVSPGSVTITASLNGDLGGACRTLGHPCPLAAFACSLGGNAAPFITSISPAQGPVGASTAVTISGGGFGTSPTVSAGSGITVSVNSASDTQIQATFQIATTAPAGNHTVTVTAAGQTSNGMNFFVQVPTSLSIVAGTDSTTAEGTCSAGSFGTGCGVTRSFLYQVNDQLGKPIQAAGLQVWDAFGTPSQNVLGLTGFITTCTNTPGVGTNKGPCGVTTNTSGQFGENNPGLSACSTVCRVNNTCTTGGPTVVDQTWHVGGSSIVQTISYYCNQVLVNGQ